MLGKVGCRFGDPPAMSASFSSHPATAAAAVITQRHHRNMNRRVCKVLIVVCRLHRVAGGCAQSSKCSACLASPDRENLCGKLRATAASLTATVTPHR